MQLKEIDAADQLAITSETPAIEMVKEAATTKATPRDVQGTVSDKTGCHFIWAILRFL